MGTRGKNFDEWLVGSEKHRSWSMCQSKDSETMLPPIALCWKSRAVGVRVGGQLCSLIITRRGSQCVRCAVPWMLNLRYTAPSRGLSWQLFCVSLRRIIGSTTAHADNKRIIDGCWTREMKCTGPNTKDADLWIWEELHRIHQERMLSVLRVRSLEKGLRYGQ